MNEKEDQTLVPVRGCIPDIRVELKYATPDNFTGRVIYDFQDAYLRLGTVKKLAQAQETFRQHGLGLKIWDGFRPVSAQFTLWEVCPNDTYVADPWKGYSNHSRGNAVDVTLVDSQGRELEMPTGFDDFTGKAGRDYGSCTETARRNAILLEETMERCGFTGSRGEWWHFTDKVRYPVAEHFEPK
ncbi:MAG: M15 family metallopeptidase [Faecousia sp.]